MMSPRPISEVRGSSNFRSTAFLAFKVICYEVPISFCSSFRFSSIFWPTQQCPYFVLATSVFSITKLNNLYQCCANSSADNPHCWELLENMVSLFHVSVPDPDWSFSDTFYLQLSGSLIYLIFTLAKALEGKITLKYTVLYWRNILVLFLEYYLQYCMVEEAISGKSLDSEVQTEQVLGMSKMMVPILAGILSALRRVIARRVSLKNQLKRRLHAITIASATSFLFPVAMWDLIIGSSDSNMELPFSAWAFLSTVLFGIILVFYVDSIAEEKLHMVFSSPRHLMAAAGCIIVMEIAYKMDFSLAGFLICSSILGIGIYEATTLERCRKDSLQKPEISNGMLDDELEMPSLPT
ncbi:hypothetical protein GOBAR_AA19903 [Gossypium barbadense]|uniref:Uncharacterized protein n=1 Tax=Gossypium barbadense TaxID=3634 RepID=A0A2P5XBP4_GOSBA|nr:hypothetical protein GOBAR_AA19903 [Gossypium barbadense]